MEGSPGGGGATVPSVPPVSSKYAINNGSSTNYKPLFAKSRTFLGRILQQGLLLQPFESHQKSWKPQKSCLVYVSSSASRDFVATRQALASYGPQQFLEVLEESIYNHPEVDTMWGYLRNELFLGFFQRSYSIYSRMAVA